MVLPPAWTIKTQQTPNLGNQKKSLANEIVPILLYFMSTILSNNMLINEFTTQIFH